MKLRYAVIYEQTPNNYCAYPPDLPGCISTGTTWDEIQQMVREAISLHIESMLENGEPLPEPRMSIEEAMIFHGQALAEFEKELLADFGDEALTLSTTFGMVEVEVSPLAVTPGR